MDKKETLEIVNEIIDVSSNAMKRKAEELLNTREWDFDAFGDRNTFARAVIEVLLEDEKYQHMARNNTKRFKDIRNALAYELSFIHTY